MTTRAPRIYVDSLGKRNKFMRALWQVTCVLFFKTVPGPLFKWWRNSLLRMFGAKIGVGCKVEASCKIWCPGNLSMGNYACLADEVDCYNVAPIYVGDYATVSQRTFLCTASHATDTLSRPLIYAPITIEQHVWVAAEAFVGPGVTIHEGAVLGARSVATRDIQAWGIYAGISARRLSERKILG